MSVSTQSRGFSKRWQMRLVWLAGFAIVAGLFAVLVMSERSPDRVLSFPNGTVLTFEQLTEPTPLPAGTYLSGSGIRAGHVPPDVGSERWWRSSYRKMWVASPAWVQPWLPRAKAPPVFFDPDALTGYRHGISNYRLWFASTGPDLESGKWVVSIERGLTRSYGYGARLMVGSGATAIMVPETRWYYVDLDTLPATATIKVHFSSGGERLTLEVPNPKYRAEGR
jgi:hypothetical protein